MSLAWRRGQSGVSLNPGTTGTLDQREP